MPRATSRQAIKTTLAELAATVDGSLTGDANASAVVVLGPKRVVIHSSAVEPGSVFFALKGKRDGHRWVADALKAKAECAVVNRFWESEVADGVPLVRVDDTLLALQRLAGWYRRQLRCHVIAVAGSLGKTTTKDAIVSFLNESEFCYGSPGSFNSQIGVPLSILGCPHDAETAVIEIAATEPSEIARLTEIVRPSTVVITKLGDRFRRVFGNSVAYAAELCGLASHLPADGLVISGDDSIDLGEHLPSQTLVVNPKSSGWPIKRINRSSPTTMRIDLRSAAASHEHITVETSSSWVADDVALAAATTVLLERPLATQIFSPTTVDLQSWRSPRGVYLLRSAAVDEPMAWSTALSDAFQAVSPNGRVHVVLTEAANDVSVETLLAVFQFSTKRLWSVLCTEGHAAQLLRKHKPPLAALRVFVSPAELSDSLTRELAVGDVVSVFTPRGQLIEGLSKTLLEAMSPITLRIDVGAINLNLSAIRHRCPGAQVMAVVKAGAYGADAPELARHLTAFGVDQFAVSHTDEGLALRRAGIARPILVLLATPDELGKAGQVRLTPCLHSPELVASVIADPTLVADVHVEVDTGMHRTGLHPSTVVSALTALYARGIVVSGLMSHLAGADDSALDSITLSQFRTFDRVVDDIRAAGLQVPPRHVIASAGVMRFPERSMEMVRVGLALMGIAPSPECNALHLVPALTLTSRLVGRQMLKPGDSVGYGGDYIAPVEHPAGTIQLGYNDGIFRSFANGGHVVIDGCRCPVIGRISMDSLTVDLMHSPDAAVGTEVLIFGTQGGSSQSIDEVAEAMDTISYEVISRLGPRVQRVFVSH